jgi:hypothetical protein
MAKERTAQEIFDDLSKFVAEKDYELSPRLATALSMILGMVTVDLGYRDGDIVEAFKANLQIARGLVEEKKEYYKNLN